MSTHSALKPPVSERDHVAGSADAPVTLVEYGDFECPHCGHAFPIVEALREHFKDRLRFVFRNFPLNEMHPHAELAAEAAEAAGAQGRFWEMHSTLFTHQSRLEPENVLHYAKQIGLNVDKFTEALKTRAFQARVREDFLSGARSGVNGTPTFFINGARYDDMPEFAAMARAIEAAANAKIS